MDLENNQTHEQTLPSTGKANQTTEEKIATAEKAALELWKESIQQAVDAMFQKAKAIKMVYVAHGYEDDGKVPDGVLRFVTNKLQITKPTASRYFHIGERETFLRSLKIELPWTSCYKIVSKIDEEHEKEFRAAFGKLKQTFKHNLDDISGADIDKVIAIALGKEPSDELEAFRDVMNNPGWKKFNQDGDVANLSDLSVTGLQGLVASLDPKEMNRGDKVNLELANRFIVAATKPAEPEPEPVKSEDKALVKSETINVDATHKEEPEPPPTDEQIQEALETQAEQDAEDSKNEDDVVFVETAQAWYTDAVKRIQLRRDIYALLRKNGLLDMVKVTIEAK